MTRADEVREYVDVLLRVGDSGDRMVEDVAIVFTADWPLRRRLALAWRVVTRR